MLNALKNLVFKPKLTKEAMEAYWHRIPSKIKVDWIRDGKYIIGQINVDNHTFMTQAISATEFVDMVNDGLFAAYDIPKNYFDVLKSRRLIPNEEQFKKLDDMAIKKSDLNFEKKEVIA